MTLVVIELFVNIRRLVGEIKRILLDTCSTFSIIIVDCKGVFNEMDGHSRCWAE